MSPSFDRPEQTFADRIPLRYIRYVLVALWGSGVIAEAVIILSNDLREMETAIALALTFAALSVVTAYFENPVVRWKLVIPLFGLPLSGFFWTRKPLFAIILFLLIFGGLAAIISFFIRKASRARAAAAQMIQERKRLDNMWQLMQSGIPAQVIKNMAPSRKRYYTLASVAVGLSCSGAILMMFIISRIDPEATEAWMHVHGLSGVAFALIGLMYLLPFIGIVGMQIHNSLFAAEVIEKQSLESELKIAQEMQSALLPSSDPNVPGYDIAGGCQPAHEVGGDFYDYIWMDQRRTRLGISLADVSGKAMKAAMTAVMTSGMLYAGTQSKQAPRDVLTSVNAPLYLRSDKRVFTAMMFATLDCRKKLLLVASAGQTPPLLVRKGKGTFIKMKGVRLPLGLKDNIRYDQTSLHLQKGDILVCYTDGITEAADASGVEFGEDGLRSIVISSSHLRAAEIRNAVLKEASARRSVGGRPDDMTIVVIKVLN